MGIAKSNRALLRDLFSPSEKLLVTITRAEGFHANESDDRLFIGRGEKKSEEKFRGMNKILKV